MATPQPHDDPRIPVTLLTGFLGAGKTTVLNAILGSAQGPKIAVIVNEFGEAGLDHDLIEVVDEGVILVQSGCLCCSLRGDLVRTLHDLMDRRVADDIAFDRVVIETTGLADPAPILQTLQVNQALSRRFRMDGTVTVADAATGSDTLDRQFEAVSQVAMADLIVLTKTDLVLEPRWRAFEARLRAINPTADVVCADHGRVEMDALWNLSGMRQNSQHDQVMAWLSPPPQVDPLQNLSGLSTTIESNDVHSPHDARIGSASIVLHDPIFVSAFDLWLDTLIALRGPDILRVKGIVHLEGIDTPSVFHGVQHLFDPPVPIRDWTGDDRCSRIVVIARDMTRPELSYSLDMLRAQQTGTTPIPFSSGAHQ
jgi:G3E family GTPase